MTGPARPPCGGGAPRPGPAWGVVRSRGPPGSARGPARGPLGALRWLVADCPWPVADCPWPGPKTPGRHPATLGTQRPAGGPGGGGRGSRGTPSLIRDSPAVKIRTDEIASVIRTELEQYANELEVSEVGRVVEVGDGIARVYGLANAMAGELLEFQSAGGAVMGQVMNLEMDTVGAVIYGDYLQVKEGDLVKSTGRLLEVPVGEALLGRVVDPLGRPIDDGPAIEAAEYRKVDIIAPGIADRQPVHEPLQFGIKAVDAMIPVGRGQRELVIGDRKTGKTAVCIDAIINQKQYWGTPDAVVCIYVAVGQKESTVAGVVEKLKKHGAMEYTIVVNASSSDPAPMQYVAPYSGCAMGEYFMWQGKNGKTPKHALLVYDDLSKQAVAYRQLSLLLRRPPGREAYPGDVFYLHSRLLERATKLSAENGGGSLTALPIIETQEGDVSAYIPTNVISITDGQIYLEPELFFSGVRPAINVGISVSRVGGSAQIGAMKKIAGSLRLDLAAYRELEAFAQLGTELDKATQNQLDRGARMVELLKQSEFTPFHVVDQVVSIFAGTRGYLDEVDLKDVRRFEKDLLEAFHTSYKPLWDKIDSQRKLTDEIDAELHATLKAFSGDWLRTKKAAKPAAKPVGAGA
ncbi:MAG: F0F1 ATP synthase subunit alpha [Phycisphaeraceae bacterium]|nr:F0F1 ATP synthase subunit alpha [Phycisphaeraceae bacterium]